MGLKGKLKRKDMEQFNDDFSEFSLSSPATKIRRLEAELPPIIEEEEALTEKAIVVYNPAVQVNPNQLHPTLSLNLNPDLITGFKNQIVGATTATQMKSGDESERKEGCLAVIPWVPCQIPIPIPSVGSRDDGQVEEQVGETELSLMEDEDEMDIEEESNNDVKKMEQEQEFGYGYGYGYGYDGLDLKQPSEALQQQQQQQQQHCMIPQPPQNPFTWPLTWSR